MRKTKKKSSDEAGHREVASPDGMLIFVLKKAKVGVYLERRQQVRNGSSTGIASVQTLFLEALAFKRFCEADDMRFEYPLTYQELAREFDDLLARGA